MARAGERLQRPPDTEPRLALAHPCDGGRARQGRLVGTGEAQAPMARVVMGGLLSSTFITLVLVPVVYSLFDKEKFKE